MKEGGVAKESMPLVDVLLVVSLVVVVSDKTAVNPNFTHVRLKHQHF